MKCYLISNNKNLKIPRRTIMDNFEQLVVYKDRALNEEKGIVRPVLGINDQGNFTILDPSSFPSGILISKGYGTIDTNYEENKLFILKEHHKDDQKTEEDGIDRYWAFGRDATALPPNTLLPTITCKLPSKEIGQLPETVKAPRGLFFILDEDANKLYGPAQAATVPDGSYQVMEAAATPKLSFGADFLGVFDVHELDNILFNLNINGQNLHFLSSANDLANKHSTTEDFMPDRKLIRYFNGLGLGRNSKTLSRKEADRLANSITDFEKMRRSANSKDARLERLKSILDRYLNESDVGYQIIRDYFATTAGERFLNDYVETNQGKLLSKHLSAFEEHIARQEDELKQDLHKIESQIKSKEDELNTIYTKVDRERQDAEKRIQDINNEADEEIQARMMSREQELQDAINALEKKKEKHTIELNDVCKSLDIANDIEAMKNKGIYYNEDNKKLEALIKGYQAQIQDKASLSERIGEFHVIREVLKGSDVTQNTTFNYTPVDFSSKPPISAGDLIDQIGSYLDWDNGKSFSRVELSNIMISITQSFLTVLAGPPGVGKTSTIIRLAQALKLGSPDDRKNFLYMPVSRGWVSSRDILGFHNSLTGSYQRARTGLYDFLRREDEGTKALQMVLLDESNLSPMEHYWSDFLGMCDNEGRNRPIDTGVPHEKDRFLKVSNNVRFIATINHDSTTERLSPRFIDRVPVISIDHEDDIEYGYESGDIKLDGTLDYTLFEKFFGKSDEAELSSTHKAILDNLINILGTRDPDLGQPVSISHRKRAAIANYCTAAINNELMDADTALDFAMSQHILPHIEGYGSKFKNRINKLSDALGKTYPRTSKHIERILVSGSDFTGTYSFF